jgi:hypothetical protein
MGLQLSRPREDRVKSLELGADLDADLDADLN